MYTFLPRSLLALKRICAKQEHSRFSATTAIRLTVREGLFRAEATDGRRAVVVQGPVPDDVPWPAFVHTSDDAFEALILPEDLERAVKVSKGTWAGQRDVIGVATTGPNDVCIGRGQDVVMTRIVEGRFPAIDQVTPKTPPVVSFKVDPKLLANTLLALSELLPDHDQRVDPTRRPARATRRPTSPP